jgi:hypothetical protein
VEKHKATGCFSISYSRCISCPHGGEYHQLNPISWDWGNPHPCSMYLLVLARRCVHKRATREWGEGQVGRLDYLGRGDCKWCCKGAIQKVGCRMGFGNL